MDRSRPLPAVPFSRPIDVRRLGPEGLDVVLRANDAESAALARQIGILGMTALEAELSLRREGPTGLHLRGMVRATITQSCVVTLDPFEAEVSEPIDLHFLPEAELRALSAEAAGPAVDPEGQSLDPDLPDPIVGNRIDLGAVAAEFLTLGLDPYPRKPGATLPEVYTGSDAAEERVSPFAVLRREGGEPPDRD